MSRDPTDGPDRPPHGSDPDRERGPDQVPEPPGTLRATGPGAVAISLCLGLVVGWLVRRVASYADREVMLRDGLVDATGLGLGVVA